MKQSILLIGLLSLTSLNAYSSNNFSHAEKANFDAIAEGGRIYDKWWKELKLEKPKSTHPSYPANAKKKGAPSWRCKECHGWDYKGIEGAYRKGSHKTGIKGIRNARNMTSNDIIATLKNKLHGYDRVMPDTALIKVANFVKNGQVDISSYLNKKTLLVNGNINRGKGFFTKNCKECHGSDGKNINFKAPPAVEYLGTVASENPVETIHKLRNGNPSAFMKGKRMPNMNNVLSLDEQIDLLSYLQTLPVK